MMPFDLLSLSLNTLNAGAVAFRVGMEADGNEYLSQLSEQLGLLLQEFDAHSIERLTHQLEEVFAAQERGDMLWVADLLEYEIRPFIVRLHHSVLPLQRS